MFEMDIDMPVFDDLILSDPLSVHRYRTGGGSTPKHLIPFSHPRPDGPMIQL